MIILDVVAWAGALAVSLPLLHLATEIAFGLRALRQADPPAVTGRGVVLVPAHNEESGIAETVQSLRANMISPFDILVVADNCDDRTAEMAQAAGAKVIERHDPDARGKGFALAFGREYLRADPPDAIIVVDADCRLAAGSADRLIGRVLQTGAPQQAVNLQLAGKSASPLVQVSNFAMLVKNLVRARGLYRIGGGVPLFGTGMAFPWSVFAEAQLSTADLVEDMQLGLSLARRGVRVHLEEGARVTSAAASASDSAGQRRRWEHGFLQTAARDALPLLYLGFLRRSRHLIALAAHFLVPPLALLFLIAVSALAALGALGLAADMRLPILVLVVSLAVAMCSVLAAWAKSGRETIRFSALLRVPAYVLWKIPIYIGFFISRQTAWNRTRRENESGHAAKDTRS